MPFHLHKHLSAKDDTATIDRIMNIVAIVYPLTGLPQVISIFQAQSAEGVSLFSWLSFTIFAAMFLIYGIAHKLKPLIITQTLWLLIDLLVVISIIRYS